MELGISPSATFSSAQKQTLMVDEAQAAIRRLNVATAALEVHTAASKVHTAIDSIILDNLLNLLKKR